jgi:uncharacterized linocin/CFP29 family protein
MVECRTPFRLARRELDTIERGGTDPDLGPLIEAARIVAHAEDKAVFEGLGPAGIRGLLAVGAPQALDIGDVDLYLEESFTFLCRTDEAIVPLRRVPQGEVETHA